MFFGEMMLDLSLASHISHDGALIASAVAFGSVLTYAGLRLSKALHDRRSRRIAVAKREEKFSLLVHGVSDTAIYMLDVDGMVSNWNPGAERLKLYTETEIVGQHFSCFYAEADRAAGVPLRNLVTAARTGTFEDEGWRLRKDGSRLWAQVIIESLHDPKGELIGFAKITRDHTDKMLADQEHRRTAENLQVTLDHMANGICLLDGESRVSLHNERFCAILGLGDMSLKGKRLADIRQLNSESFEEHVREHMRLISAGGGERVSEMPDGKVLRYVSTPTDTGAWVITLEDVTDQTRQAERIAHMARHDPLTGLPNRPEFTDALDAAIAEADVLGANVAVINIDLDCFKEINDTFGHAIGDKVLSKLANRFKALATRGEVVSRFGGDEFVAMKLYRKGEELDDFLRAMATALSARMLFGATEVEPGASLGVSIYPGDADDRTKLMGNADMAMYRAKADPQETICFYEPSMDEAMRARRDLARDLWTALKEEQFFLHYQVQRQAHTLDVTGYEVLLRWQHPVQGLISPAVFIPIAEECGAINGIGEWVLQRACSEAAARLNGRIAVNLSPVQLGNACLPEKVREILVKTGLSPDRLELEVTETAIIADKQRALHVLRQIKAMGVTIAIDDFGTGYSSLETLRSFPFDKIKLDRSFVIDLDTDHQARAFVRAMLALGKSLNVPVLAEGVETESQMKVLAAEGCDQFQGYLLGRPDRLEVVRRANEVEVPLSKAS